MHTITAAEAVAKPVAEVDYLADGTAGIDVEIVVPVYNEQDSLAASVRRLHRYVRTDLPFSALITIADNASTDRTWQIAAELADALPGVRAVRFAAKGRGGALRAVWSTSRARVVSYTDVDLSTDLAALLPLLAPLLSGHSDVAIGSRLARSARVIRGTKREVISRCYNLLLRSTMRARFSDAQCGFKAMRVEAARALLPYVRDSGWFFDTEVLLLAERAGLRIAEVPVDWVDDPDSRVDIVATAVADLKGLARVARALATGALPLAAVRAQAGADRHRSGHQVSGVSPRFAGQAIRFGLVGVASTVAYLLLFLVLRTWTGPQPANLIALSATAVANTAANRRFTFGVRGPGVARHHALGLVVFALCLALTSGCLAVADAAAAPPSRVTEIVAVVTGNLLATVARFVLMREWVFRSAARPSVPESPARTRGPATQGELR